MAYDGFYAGLSDRASVSEILNQAILVRNQIEAMLASMTINEAPSDNKIYGRKNKTWVEVTGGGPGPDPDPDPDDILVDFQVSALSSFIRRRDDAPPIITRLSTVGNQFVDALGQKVRLKSINWFGAESENNTPHGTWARSYKSIIEDIQSMGFNCIRIPLSGAFSDKNLAYAPTAVNMELNEDFSGLTAHGVIKAIIDYCAVRNMYVVLDYHRIQPGGGADGSPLQFGKTLEDFVNFWRMLASEYRDHINIVGADLYNEPHLLQWNEWVDMATLAGNAIHAINPDWIIFVEGAADYNGTTYWWGGNLRGVADKPVVLNLPGKLAYSPHEYGQSVSSNQPWLAYDGQPPPAGWPTNVQTIQNANWGYIYNQNIAPIWIGEFGGHFGVDGTGMPTKPHGQLEKIWLQQLIITVNNTTGDNKGMSFSYWGYGPLSADTGGLIQDDWITHQAIKLQILEPLLGT